MGIAEAIPDRFGRKVKVPMPSDYPLLKTILYAARSAVLMTGAAAFACACLALAGGQTPVAALCAAIGGVMAAAGRELFRLRIDGGRLPDDGGDGE